MLIGSMLMPVAFFGFAQDFLMKERWTWLFLGYLSYLFIQIANFQGDIITDAYIQAGMLYNQYDSVGIIISGMFWTSFVSFLGFELFQEYRKALDAFYRNRIKYLLVVTIMTFAGSLTNATQLKVFPVDIAFNAISALLISYAILRYRLLDIKNSSTQRFMVFDTHDHHWSRILSYHLAGYQYLSFHIRCLTLNYFAINSCNSGRNSTTLTG